MTEEYVTPLKPWWNLWHRAFGHPRFAVSLVRDEVYGRRRVCQGCGGKL